jgi:hypothetical protein
MWGLGASIEMMQKQVNLINRRIDANKEALESIDQYWKTEKLLSDADVDRLKNAQNDIELQKAAADIAAERNMSTEDLLASAKQYLTITNDTWKQQQKILDITKQVREGYLSAFKEMAIGLGQFGKILGTQTRAARQLMELTKRATGTYALNTMAMGGLQPQQWTSGGLGTGITAVYGPGGYQPKITKAEERARLGARIYRYNETFDPRKMGQVPRMPIGAAIGMHPEDFAAIMESAAQAGGRGGRTITGPRRGMPDVGSKTFYEKGTLYTTGATLPGQQTPEGIPFNYMGGARVAAVGEAILGGSRGQISGTGGPAITPNVPVGQAYASDWMRSLAGEQKITNDKLEKIQNSLDSGLNVKAMNSF